MVSPKSDPRNANRPPAAADGRRAFRFRWCSPPYSRSHPPPLLSPIDHAVYLDMMRLGTSSLTSLLVRVFGLMPVRSEPQPAETLDFSEVFNVIREHLPGTSESDLNRAAVQGLLTSLEPKVTLIPK